MMIIITIIINININFINNISNSDKNGGHNFFRSKFFFNLSCSAERMRQTNSLRQILFTVCLLMKEDWALAQDTLSLAKYKRFTSMILAEDLLVADWYFKPLNSSFVFCFPAVFHLSWLLMLLEIFCGSEIFPDFSYKTAFWNRFHDMGFRSEKKLSKPFMF